MKQTTFLFLFMVLLSYTKAQTIELNTKLNVRDDSNGASIQISIQHISDEAYAEAIEVLSPIILSKDSFYMKSALYLRGYCFYRINRLNLACVDWKYYLLDVTEENDLKEFCQQYADSIEEVKNRYYPPEFPGGKDSLDRLMSLLRYPNSELYNDRQGSGILRVYINTKGEVYKVTKLEGEDVFAAPLIKALNILPNFSPARENNITIDTSFLYKFIFHIETEDNVLSEEERNQYDICYIMYRKRVVNFSNDYPNFSYNADDYYSFGITQLKKKNYETALVNFNKCLQIKPWDFEAIVNRGITYYYLGNLESACKDWQKGAIAGDEQAYDLYLQKCK